MRRKIQGRHQQNPNRQGPHAAQTLHEFVRWPEDILTPSIQARSGRARWQYRTAAVALLAHAGLVAKLLGEYSFNVVHYSRGPFVILLFLIAVSTLATLALGVRSGRRSFPPFTGLARWRTGIVSFATLLPLVVWFYIGYATFLQLREKHVEPTVMQVLATVAALNVAELRVEYEYPNRLESDRLVMFYHDGLQDPAGDLARMDSHVARLEADIGRPVSAKIYWVRGRLLGQSRLSAPGFALGSADESDVALDRHELAHATINQHLTPWTLPPMMLIEGWAVAQENSTDSTRPARWAIQTRRDVDSFSQLDAVTWADLRGSLVDPEGFTNLMAVHRQNGGQPAYLATLTNQYWYHRDAGAVYSIGGGFVDFLVRRYGPQTFAKFYWRVRPTTFAAECESVYGMTMSELEHEFWLDAEKRAKQ